MAAEMSISLTPSPYVMQKGSSCSRYCATFQTRIISGIDQSYALRLCEAQMHRHSVSFSYRKMTSDVRSTADKITLISATNDEVVGSGLRIDLENVVQDRSTADLDHRLWAYDRFFTKPRPEPTLQYDCFYSNPVVLLRGALCGQPTLLFNCERLRSTPYSTRSMPNCVCLLCDPMIFQAQLSRPAFGAVHRTSASCRYSRIDP